MESPWELSSLHMTLRLVLALAFGGLVGFEREQNNHPAGFRTHILVCLGSCLIMLLSMYGFGQFASETSVRLDPARLAAQVITGIGFLGAGTIIFNGNSISGLTTAASLWVVAAIGLATGAGFYYSATITTLFVLLSLWILNKVEKRWLRGKRLRSVRIEMPDSPGILTAITGIMNAKGAEIRKLTVEQLRTSEEGRERLRIELSVRLAKPDLLVALAEELHHLPDVTNISIE
ncbi:MgtC/SapB family protein [Paenibacillus hodogayensis]|uniref:MgtC/SapB family protein n=1 Tax=Paenibacillus hodogayensis TaxID=279208 RepID=A0ABV5VZ80_9BACL